MGINFTYGKHALKSDGNIKRLETKVVNKNCCFNSVTGIPFLGNITQPHSTPEMKKRNREIKYILNTKNQANREI